MDKFTSFLVALTILVFGYVLSAIVAGIYESQGFVGTILSTLGVFAFGFVWMYIYKKWGDD